jgi:hypothetical protein
MQSIVIYYVFDANQKVPNLDWLTITTVRETDSMHEISSTERQSETIGRNRNAAYVDFIR